MSHPENGICWALPPAAAPPDQLRTRIDIYDESIILKTYQEDAAYIRMVAPDQLAHALNGEVNIATGLLPPDVLWWHTSVLGETTALWREPGRWPVALQTEPFAPPRRLVLPMPGLVFVCMPGRAPWLYAAMRRPARAEDRLYHAPTFNVFRDGRVCAGTHRFPHQAAQMPESFFRSFFSQTGDSHGRSRKHPQDLARLWDELDGANEYPLHDLEPWGTVADAMDKGRKQ